jgi:hypothetical protein
MGRIDVGANLIAAALLGAPFVVPAPVEAQSAGEPCDQTRRARARLEFELPAAKKKSEARWVGHWSGALEEAARRNVPLLAVFSDDQSAGFRTVSKTVYASDEFAPFSHEVVLLAAFDGLQHASKPQLDGEGRERAWCSLFDCWCDDHRAAFAKVRADYVQREFWNPVHLLVDADAVELTRAEGHEVTLERLREELAFATKERKGPSLSFRDYQALLAKLRELVDLRAKRGHAWVHGELGKLVMAERTAPPETKTARPLGTARMADFAEELRSALVEEAEGLVADAVATARRGDVAEARRSLVALVRGAKGLGPDVTAQQELAKLPAEAGKRGG